MAGEDWRENETRKGEQVSRETQCSANMAELGVVAAGSGRHAVVSKWPGRVHEWQRHKCGWLMGRYATSQQDLGWLAPGGRGCTSGGKV